MLGIMAGIALMTLHTGACDGSTVSAQGASVCLGDRGARRGRAPTPVAEFSGYGEIRSHGLWPHEQQQRGPAEPVRTGPRSAGPSPAVPQGTEAGWCADAERQGRSLGTRVIAWDCQSTGRVRVLSATTHQAGTASTLTRRALTEADVSQMLRLLHDPEPGDGHRRAGGRQPDAGTACSGSSPRTVAA